MKRNTTKTGVFVPSDHHNGHLRGRGDSEPHPCFLLIRDLQRRPTGAGRRSQAAFRANLYARKRRGRKKEEKSGRTQFFWGLNIWLIAPNPGANRLLRPFSPPPSLQVATMGTHGPVAAHPPPAQRAAESRARLCCILGR